MANHTHASPLNREYHHLHTICLLYTSHYDNPFELLIAVILSEQCTDKRVNMITPALYRDFPTPEALAATTPDVVSESIRRVSYPNNKAKHLVGMAPVSYTHLVESNDT